VLTGNRTGLRPCPGSPGSTDAVRRPGIEKRMVPLFDPKGAQVFPVLDAKRRQVEQAERAILFGQGPVDLDRGQAAGRGYGCNLFRGLIDEDADAFHPARHPGDERLRLVDADLALTAGEDETEEVDAELDRELDILRPRIATDLDLGHRPLSSRTLASRSGARSSDSPTSAALTPRRSSASISARLSMPLSLTTRWPAGIKGRNRVVVSLTVCIAVRSRLLMPMIAASACSARSTSVSSWTSTSARMP